MPIVLHTPCVILCTLALFGHTCALTYENMTLLKTHLLTGYDLDVRPVNIQSDSINVTVGLTIYQILEIDTVRGVISITSTLEVSWMDERMTWTPSDYGGITSVMFQKTLVWTPPLQNAQPVEFKALGEKWMHVTYQSNGFSFWRPGSVNDMTCPMDMKYWPFDIQKCEVSYFPYDYWYGEVNLLVGQLNIDSLAENGEWSLEETSAYTRNIYGVQETVFMLKLKRRPVFYVLALIFPLFGMGILTGFVFLLPSDSGERVSYSITILLALTVFLTIVSDSIPKVSNPVPLLCIFLLLGIIMSSITVFIVILNLAIYHREPKKPVGPWYAALVRKTRCKSAQIHDEDMIREKLQDMDKTANIKFGKKMTITALNSTDVDKNHIQRKGVVDYTGNDVDDAITWKEVSYAIDAISFVVMTAFQVVPVLALVIVLVTQ